MLRYLLDTNHLNVAFLRRGPVREQVIRLQDSGNEVGTCIPVLCEVHAGLVFTKKCEENYALLDEYLLQT
jgi:predicted nucleic acid-binding protein